MQWCDIWKEPPETSHEVDMQSRLSRTSLGRILLHVLCACRDQKYQWHWRGIRRELKRI